MGRNKSMSDPKQNFCNSQLIFFCLFFSLLASCTWNVWRLEVGNVSTCYLLSNFDWNAYILRVRLCETFQNNYKSFALNLCQPSISTCHWRWVDPFRQSTPAPIPPPNILPAITTEALSTKIKRAIQHCFHFSFLQLPFLLNYLIKSFWY